MKAKALKSLIFGCLTSLQQVTLFAFVFAISLVETSWAGQFYDDIQVVKDSQQNVTLTTKCSLISKATENLFKLGPIVQNGELCSVNLNQSLPKKMIELHDTFLNHSGPNCWNTSLFMAAVVESQRSVLGEEMDFLTSSVICRQLSENEKPKFGDLIAIHGRGTPAEMHGFTYINDLISFSKSGFDVQFGYEIVSSNYVFTLFALGSEVSKPKCRRVRGIPNESDCPVYAQYFRCQPRVNLLEKSQFYSKAEFILLDQKISYIEKTISEATVAKAAWNLSESAAIKNEISEIKKAIDLKLSTLVHLKSNVEYFFWQSARLRLDSLNLQIEFLETP